MEKIKKAWSAIVSVTPIFLSVVATIAIIWILSTSYDVTGKMWFLPLIAGVTAISAILLPVLCDRWEIFNSIIAAGWTLFVFQILPSIPLFASIFNGVAIICIGFITELAVNKNIHWGDIVFDSVILGLTAYIIKFASTPLAKLIILLICYSLVIIVDFQFSFSFKQGKHARTNAVE